MAVEKFDYDGVKNKMIELESLFDEFALKLKSLNLYINEKVNVSPDSAIYGEAGSGILKTWNENAATFGDFKANFDKWSQLVTIVQMNNMQFEGENFRSTGSTLGGVQESRNQLVSDLSNDVVSKSVFKDGENIYETVVRNNSTIVTKYDSSGKPVEITTTYIDKDGNLVKIVKTATTLTSSVYASNGNLLKGPYSESITNGLENVPDYRATSNASSYESVLNDDVEVYTNSIIETGSAFSMSRGTKIYDSESGKELYFYGVATASAAAGYIYFSDVDPRSGGYSSNAKMYALIPETGKIELVGPYNAYVSVLNSSDISTNTASTFRLVKPESFEVLDIKLDSSDPCWAVTKEYIEVMYPDNLNVSDIVETNTLISTRQSFTIDPDMRLVETDGAYAYSNSDVFYNNSGSEYKSNTLYHDEDSNGIIGYGEVWEGTHTQESIEKLIKSADNNDGKYRGCYVKIEEKD